MYNVIRRDSLRNLQYQYQHQQEQNQMGSTYSNLTHKTQCHTQPIIPEFSFGIQDMILVKKRHISQSYYISQKPIGSGAYGQVYRAIHKQTKVTRAVKKISTKRLGNQFSILRQLDHPNILKIYEMFWEENACYLVMEYYEGGTLGDYLAKQRRPSETTILKIMFQILSAINYLHSKNIIHGDIKPQNILLDETKQKIYLADFGLATYESNKICTPTGTKHYIAPDGSRLFCQKKFDMWACGVTMYLAFTGRLPSSKIWHELQSSRFDAISIEAKDLLLKLLHPDPHTRITAKQAIFHKWFINIHSQFYCGSMQWLRSIVQNMLQNIGKNSIQRLIKFYITNFVVPKQKRKYFQHFTAFDKNLDGGITKQQFRRIFQKLNISSDIDRIYSMIDTNNSGKIDYAQFLAIASTSEVMENNSILKAFEWLDLNKDRMISKEQLEQCLNRQLPPQVIDEFMNLSDKNGNGYIQYDEFLQFITT